jgi:16S rRNA G966 N2-methylase RsmD
MKKSINNSLIPNNEFETNNENKEEQQQEEELNKKMIANKIKPISEIDAELDFEALKNVVNAALLSANTNDNNANGRIEFKERIGNNIVDFFTFKERLETRGKYNIHFYDFVKNIEEFKKKKFIQNMFTYYSTVKNARGLKNEYIVMKEVYNICISAINIFRPLLAVEVYTKYKPSVVLDPCAGWGGRAVGAAVCGNIQYFGIDVNHSLKIPYQRMCAFLNSKINIGNANDNTQKINLKIADATTFDYSQIEPKYDMVFTSPPYYFIEKYSHNKAYNNSKDEMDEQFYVPLFSNTYLHLLPGGCMALNVNREIYERVCVRLFGLAHQTMNCKKSKRQNEYREMIYIWTKT